MNEITIDTELLTSMPQLPEILHNRSTHPIPDAPEGEISVSIIMNNFVLETCESLNLTNERGRGTDVRLEKDETDTCNFQHERQE